MNVLDFISGIPYRIAGVIVLLLCLVLSIPFIVIPTLLGSITKNMTFKEACSIGKDMMGDLSLKELFEVMDSNGWWGKMVRTALDKATLGFCLVLGGIYYKEFYNYMLNQ